MGDSPLIWSGKRISTGAASILAYNPLYSCSWTLRPSRQCSCGLDCRGRIVVEIRVPGPRASGCLLGLSNDTRRQAGKRHTNRRVAISLAEEQVYDVFAHHHGDQICQRHHSSYMAECQQAQLTLKFGPLLRGMSRHKRATC